MILKLNELNKAPIRRRAATDQSPVFKPRVQVVVQLVPMTVALAHHGFTVEVRNLGARLQHREESAQSHRATLVGDVTLVVHQINDRVLRERIKLG